MMVANNLKIAGAGFAGDTNVATLLFRDGSSQPLPLMSKDALADRLAKTGGTPFRCMDVQARIEPGLTLSASAINGMRRDVLNELAAVRGRRDGVKLNRPKRVSSVFGRRDLPAMTAQVTNREQITGRLLKMKPAVLYVPMHVILEDMEYFHGLCAKQNIAVVLPRIVHDNEMERLKNALRQIRSLGIREVLAGNLGLLIPARECGFAIRGDFGLNVFNSRSMDMVKDLELRSAMLSFEMTLPQIRDVSKPVDTELLVYGRMPLMVTENCIIKNRTGKCSCNQGPTKLVDKTGAEFPIIKDGNTCRSVMLNGKKLSMLDRQDDLQRLGLWPETVLHHGKPAGGGSCAARLCGAHSL